MNKLSSLIVTLLMVVLTSSVFGEGKKISYYDLLTTDRVGAKDFIKKHPKWDGRGVVIAVLDTGVDMSVPGLTKTSTGEVKVIEARDFSGQGVIHLRKAKEGDENGEPVLKTGSGVVRGYDKLEPKPEKDGLLLGFVEERRFKNSSVSDVNNNGKSNDTFAVLVGKLKEGDKERWAAWVDTDADGHIDDEQHQLDYSEGLKYFYFAAGGTEKERPTMGVALTIDAKRKEVNFHFPDGAHGTHVAGIAAGYSLFDKLGFNGIAPGAKVMSLKIGDNTLSGGSTTSESMKKAIEFAGKWSKENKTPVVVNMSYGIGTELEGESDIDRITDQLVKKYPLLSVATSAGNAGPGLSTVGTPAGATLAFSTGALLTRANAKTLYGASISKDAIFYFSSRGGELSKPDGLAPGCAVSQVPHWEGWPIMRGTSMASPQAAGCLALMASGAVQSDPGVKFNGGLLVRALRNSGRPMKGHSLVDQGPGVIHVPSAFKGLKKLASRQYAGSVAGYKVRADCPTCANTKAAAAFFRTGTYVPKKPITVDFSISPMFMSELSEEQKEGYFETFDLQVEGDWLEPTSDAIFFRKGDSASVDVFFDPDKLKKPGLYTARIRGTSRELNERVENTLFELWAVVIKPYVFDLTSGYHRRFEKESMEPGEVKRYFLRVPEGAASLRLVMSPVGKKYTQSKLTVFDPEGREYHVPSPYAESTRVKSVTLLVPKDDLTPGVWEVVVLTHYAARDESHYNLDVTFSGFHYEAPATFSYEMGAPPRGEFTLQTLFDQVFEGRGSGGIYGYFRETEYSSKGDKIVLPVTLEKGVAQVKYKFTMEPETYARFTDVAVTVTNNSGRAVDKSGFTSRYLTVTIENEDPTTDTDYTMEINGGFAERSGKPWSIKSEEYYQTVEHVPAKVWCDGYGYFVLYPNRAQTCEFELQGKPSIAPEGYMYYGELRFKDAKVRKNALIMPLKLFSEQ